MPETLTEKNAAASTNATVSADAAVSAAKATATVADAAVSADAAATAAKLAATASPSASAVIDAAFQENDKLRGILSAHLSSRTRIGSRALTAKHSGNSATRFSGAERQQADICGPAKTCDGNDQHCCDGVDRRRTMPSREACAFGRRATRRLSKLPMKALRLPCPPRPCCGLPTDCR